VHGIDVVDVELESFEGAGLGVDIARGQCNRAWGPGRHQLHEAMILIDLYVLLDVKANLVGVERLRIRQSARHDECGGSCDAGTTGQDGRVVTVDDVRAVLARLPRSSEVLVRDRVKFRVGQIVYVAFSQDETEIGFAFPKEERAALVAARPDVFFLPRESELRFNWVEAWLAALDADEMRELVLDAWRMVVPQRVAREVLGPPGASH
jgi:hypothetical protein